jgi:hypothetical protein
MGWPSFLRVEFVLTAAISLMLLMPLVLLVSAFITGLFERQSVRLFQASDAPLRTDSYRAAMVDAALREGFSIRGTGQHVKYANVTAVLLLSADRSTIAVVAAGSIAKLRLRRTLLFSRRADATLRTTVDESTFEPDPGMARTVIIHGSFDELWRAHAADTARSRDAVSFSATAGWTELDAMHRLSVERKVAAGLVRYVDMSREAVRYTIATAFRASILHGLKFLVSPADRRALSRPRPGDGYAPAFAVGSNAYRREDQSTPA